jgi:hypothetical protein
MVKKKTVIWKYQGNEITDISQTPEGSIGFIYRIRNLTNGKHYIGRKNMASYSKKKLTIAEKKLPGNSRKTFKREVKESPWKNYTGSSKTLTEDLKNGDIYEKEILMFCLTKAEMTYYESSMIICSGALLDDNSYNFWVSCRVYKKHLLPEKQI